MLNNDVLNRSSYFVHNCSVDFFKHIEALNQFPENSVFSIQRVKMSFAQDDEEL